MLNFDSGVVGGRRITLFAGHYGSGKTNIALNYARALKRAGRSVTVADLDIVNPYFRTKDSAAELAAEGIGLVVSDYANSNVDFPALPKEIYGLLASESDEEGNSFSDAERIPRLRGDAEGIPRLRGDAEGIPRLRGAEGFATTSELLHVVMDVGGDDRGALALGRYVPDIRAENDYEMLAVVNASRPLTGTAADTVAILREIERACALPFTGLVNNTNLGLETTAADVLASLPYAEEVAALMRLPVRFTCASVRVAAELAGKVPSLFPIEIQRLYYQIEA